MFDEQDKNWEVPKNLPTEPVDMFVGVEKDDSLAPANSTPDALSVGLLKKKDEVTSPPNLSSITNDGNLPSMSAPATGKIIMILVAVLLLGGLAYGGWRFFYGNKNNTDKSISEIKETNESNQTQVSQTSTIVVVTSTSENIPAQINNDQILFGQTVDRDKDGIDDLREKELGTDQQKADTDGDGINDGEEVITHKTDPLKSDTDGDGLSDGDEILIWRANPLNRDTDSDTYLDGEEVRNGYNPIGPGKLFTSTSTPVSGSTTTASVKN